MDLDRIETLRNLAVDARRFARPAQAPLSDAILELIEAHEVEHHRAVQLHATAVQVRDQARTAWFMLEKDPKGARALLDLVELNLATAVGAAIADRPAPPPRAPRDATTFDIGEFDR